MNYTLRIAHCRNLLLGTIFFDTAIVAPTIGLLPIPRKPIISTCAGTDEEPANCASECIRPIVSVINSKAIRGYKYTHVSLW